MRALISESLILCTLTFRSHSATGPPKPKGASVAQRTPVEERRLFASTGTFLLIGLALAAATSDGITLLLPLSYGVRSRSNTPNDDPHCAPSSALIMPRRP